MSAALSVFKLSVQSVYQLQQHKIEVSFARAAQQFLKWGVQVRERSERKNFFLTLPLLAPGGT